MKHILTGEEFTRADLDALLEMAGTLKKRRASGQDLKALQGKTLAMIFEKPSLRTRFSFFVAMTELGGHVVESVTANRKEEEPQDLARVVAGYCHAAMIRIHEDKRLEKMAAVSRIPIINGLSDLHHPCQILADLLTLKEKFGKLAGLNLCYVGDGNNILHSLLLLAPLLGVNVRYACPEGYSPNSFILKKAKARLNSETGDSGSIDAFSKVRDAAAGAHAVYTDVWTSMGFEGERAAREKAFAGYQVNEALMKHADPKAVVLHCMPMERGKEISDTLPDSPQSVIFQQSENRLHVQKALLVTLLGGKV